jgi:arabinogalactan endo-1,4-beta-galactosidase
MNEHVSRRSFLRTTAAGAATVTLGALLGQPAGSAAAATTFHKGAILKGYGLSAIRLRMFVNPSSDPVNGHCGVSETATMARRVQDAGMAVNIDYHFSDTWADEGRQYPPAAWKNLSYSQMRSAIASYTHNSMNVVKGKGVTPTWVLYWEPEGYSPFTGYNMGAWNSSTREPTAIMNGFTAT